MGYDPNEDEPIYSKREMEEAIQLTIAEIFKRGPELIRELAASLPLTIEGRWRRDKVYQPGALVYHETRQWIANAETASEPSVNNAIWKLVNLPKIGPDTISGPGDNEEGK